MKSNVSKAFTRLFNRFREHYNLSDPAKKAARDLVKAWDEGKITSRLTLTYKETIGTERIVVDVTLGKLGNFECPALYDLYELDAQELLNMIEGRRGTNNEILYWYLQMSQTLRYAVKNDFRRGINPQTWSIIGATTGIIALLVTIVDRFMV